MVKKKGKAEQDGSFLCQDGRNLEWECNRIVFPGLEVVNRKTRGLEPSERWFQLEYVQDSIRVTKT